MIRNLIGALILWIGCQVVVHAQTTGFDSFVSSIASRYHVDVAIAPELIPVVDSVLQSGNSIHSIHELVKLLVAEENLSYQLIDGNKLMLRRDVSQTSRIAAMLEGNIYSDADDTPLAFAAIQLKGTNTGTLSDDDGHFILPVPDTSGEIVIHYLGYATVTMPVASLMQGTTKIRMKASEIPLEEVVIIIPAVSATHMGATQTLDLAGYQIISEEDILRGDLDRMISAMTSYTTFSSDEGIRIRGAESENSLLLMDGLPVYDPYHFYNIFSPFNSHYFSTIKLYKNNLPVQYGGRIDGMIQLESDRRVPKSHFVFDTDLLLTSAESQLVLPGSVTLKLGGRISHTSILNDALRDQTVIERDNDQHFQNDNEYTSIRQPAFNFHDVNAGITKTFANGAKVYVSAFDSHDELENKTVSEFLAKGGGTQQQVIDVKQTHRNLDGWGNRGIAAGIEVPTDNRTVLDAEVYTSRYRKKATYFNQTVEERMGEIRERANYGIQENYLTSVGIKCWIHRHITRTSGFQVGSDMQWHRSMFQASENNESYVFGAQRENEVTLFGEYNTRLLTSLAVFAGARLTHLQSTNSLYVLPNLRINYYLTDRVHLRTAYSKNLQTVYELTVENRFGREIETLALSDPEEGYPVLTSDKYMVGAGYRRDHFGIDAEVYYKKTDGLTRVAAIRPDPGHQHGPKEDFYQLFTGDGWTAGVDVNVLYTKGKFDGAVYYTLSKIAERYDRLYNSDYFSPQEDRRHQLKLSGKYKLGAFEVSSLLTYKSKAPYLSYVQLESNSGGGIDQAERESVIRYLPEYVSLDLGIDYNFRLFRQPAQLGVSLINATNHANIDGIQHLGRVSRDFGQSDFYITQQTELLGRTGNVRVRVVF